MESSQTQNYREWSNFGAAKKDGVVKESIIATHLLAINLLPMHIPTCALIAQANL